MNHLTLLTPNHCRLADQAERLERKGISGTAAVHFARTVVGSGDAILGCDTCQAALPEQIEAELNNTPNPAYRSLRQHIDLCPTCTAAYLDLLEVALEVEEGPLPAPLLPIDLSFLEPPSGRSSFDA